MNGNTTQAPDTSLPIPMGIQQAQIWSKSLLATVHAISTSEGDEAEIKESLFSIAELLGKVIGQLDQGVDELMARRKSDTPIAIDTAGTKPANPILALEVPLRRAHGQAVAIYGALADEYAGDPLVAAGEALAFAMGDLCEQWRELDESQRGES